MNDTDQMEKDYLMRLSVIVQMDGDKVVRSDMMMAQRMDNN